MKWPERTEKKREKRIKILIFITTVLITLKMRFDSEALRNRC